MKGRWGVHTRLWLLCAGLWGGLTACTTVPSPPTPAAVAPLNAAQPAIPTAWAGRLSLTIEKAHAQFTHIHIVFELEGDAQEGQLQVEGPFGTAAILLRWQPGQAVLSQGERSYRFPSLAELIRRSIDTDLPIEAVFAWLRNETVAVPGWQVESVPSQGGPLVARRYEPWPRLELRVALQP